MHDSSGVRVSEFPHSSEHQFLMISILCPAKQCLFSVLKFAVFSALRVCDRLETEAFREVCKGNFAQKAVMLLLVFQGNAVLGDLLIWSRCGVVGLWE